LRIDFAWQRRIPSDLVLGLVLALVADPAVDPVRDPVVDSFVDPVIVLVIDFVNVSALCCRLIFKVALDLVFHFVLGPVPEFHPVLDPVLHTFTKIWWQL
jgi:hypothetical protein